MAVLNNTGILAGASGAVGGDGDPEKRSTRFNDNDSAYLNWTPTSAGSTATWTLSFWIKRGNLGSNQYLFAAKDSSNYFELLLNSSDKLAIYNYTGSGAALSTTDRVFRDCSAFYHIVYTYDTSQSGDDKLKLYVNGTQETSFSTDNRSSTGASYWNTATVHTIGSSTTPHNHFDGLISDVNFVDGLALAASSFGMTDATTGQWVPKEYTGSYGTNGFHLAMDPAETGTNYSGTATEAVGGSMQNGGTPYITDMSPADAEFQYYTNTNGAYNIFNGSIDGSAASQVYLYDNNETTVWTFDLRDEETVTSVKVWGCGGDSYGNTAAGDNWVCSLLDANKSAISNTSVTITSATYAWFTVPVAGTPKYLKFTQTTGMGPFWLGAIQVNGKILVNHTAIGHDSSGQKNHWHENNLVSTETSLPCVEFDGTGDYLEATSATDFAFAQADFTLEAYIYATSLPSTNNRIFCSGAGGAGDRTNFQLIVGSAGYLKYDDSSTHSTSNGVVTTNRWYHVAATRSGTTLRLFVDGVLQSTHTNNYDNTENGGVTIGREYGYTSNWNGYISNVRIIKGTALYTENFTIPATPLTDVTNTKLLCCQSNTSAIAAAVAPGTITANGDAAATTKSDGENLDLLADVPGAPYDNGANGGANYCTLNPLKTGSGITLSQGNLLGTSSGNVWKNTQSTIGMNSGKWYVEFGPGLNQDSNNNICAPSVCLSTHAETSYPNVSGSTNLWYNGALDMNGSQTSSWASTYGMSEVLGCALDADTGEVWWSIDGVWQGSGNPATGANPAGTLTNTNNESFVFAAALHASGYVNINFGQRTFTYTPPTGFKALNTFNLDTPLIDDPSKHFDVATDTGAGILDTAKDLTDGADFVWIKDKATSSTNHSLFNRINDSDMDGDPHLRSNEVDDEATCGTYSTPTGSSVAWVWNAGAAANTTSVSVGDYNSSTYNQDQKWSTYGTFTNTYGGNYDWPGVFNDGMLWDDYGSVYTSNNAKWELTSSLACSSKVKIYVRDPGTFTINHGLSDATSITVSGGGYQFVETNFSGNISNFHLAGSGIYLMRIYVDNKALIDNDITINSPSIASEHRVSTAAGFSIVSYTGVGNTVSTVGTGLNVNAVPSLIIVKDRDTTNDWAVYHSALGATKDLTLNTDDDARTRLMWNNTAPTSSVFTIGAGNNADYRNRVNNTNDYIALVWSEVEGYSKFGSYEGSSDLPFVWCGFMPRYLLVKKTNASESWILHDTARSPYNVSSQKISPNSDGGETSSTFCDILSNGFKLRTTTSGEGNDGGSSYIFAAFAESPFKYSNAR